MRLDLRRRGLRGAYWPCLRPRRQPAPDCPVTIGMPEARLTACHPATMINERVSESGTFRVYDARPGSPRFIFVRDGVVTGWQAR